MLVIAAYILAMDPFGQITDNAGDIVEMSRQPEEIRKRADRLDPVRNFRGSPLGATNVSEPKFFVAARRRGPDAARVRGAGPDQWVASVGSMPRRGGDRTSIGRRAARGDRH
jgi:hypothetical protein